MLIPYRADVAMHRHPVGNYALIGSMVVAFGLQRALPTETLLNLALFRWNLGGFLTYQWLHGGVLHLAGNMVFLWVFGNAICAKVGNTAYVPLFAGLGFVAGLAHLLISDSLVVGASGAINGIVGMFLILYPWNEVSCFIWWWGPRFFSMSSIFLIVYWLAWDILGLVLTAKGGGGVAYGAHIGGFLAGAVLASALVWTGVLQPEQGEETLWDRFRDPGARGRRHRPTFSGGRGKYASPVPQESGFGPPVPFSAPRPGAPSMAPPLHSSQPDRITVLCQCGKLLTVPRDYAGKKGKCPVCKEVTNIPENA